MGKIAAIDFGTKNIGLAVSDENKMIARRFSTVQNTRNREMVKETAKALSDQDIELVILGMPLGLEGKPTKLSQQTAEFGKKLARLMQIELKEWNESYSSQQAAELIGSAKKLNREIHSESARIILQEYLDFLNAGI